MEWISVKDRLPKSNQLVLVYCESRMITPHVTCASYMKNWDAKIGKWSRKVRAVTHWMPLPEPPKEE